MKWLIASDLHGSAYYCRKLLEAYDLEKADRMLLLGDILYHGSRNDLPTEYAPKQVIAMLNARRQDILLYGHTHVPKCVEHEEYVYLNHGSVSMPKEDSWHGYMTLEDGVFLWKDFDGNEKIHFVMKGMRE